MEQKLEMFVSIFFFNPLLLIFRPCRYLFPSFLSFLPSQVSVVAIVRSINEGPTNVSYKIEDGTAEMDAKIWVDKNNDDLGKTEGIE